MGPHNIAINPDYALSVYQQEYNNLKYAIQDKQIDDIIQNLSFSGIKLAEQDRLVVDALEVMYDRENRNKTMIMTLKKQLPEQTISSINIQFSTEIIHKNQNIAEEI